MEDTNSWECPACTYKNGPESYRCLMCDFRKGTSTRKPRINPEMMAKQVARQQEQIKQQVLKASATKTKTIASEKSAFRRVDDTNSNSSIASNGSSGRLSPLANSNCSTSQDSPNCTANTSLSFDNSFRKLNTASGSKLPPSRNSMKNESEEEMEEHDESLHMPGPSTSGTNRNCNSTNTKKKVKLIGPKARLKNVDRTDVHVKEVTVRNVTVLITEFKPAKRTKTEKEETKPPGETCTNKKGATGKTNGTGNATRVKLDADSTTSGTSFSKKPPVAVISPIKNKSSTSTKKMISGVE